jgi:hypothetical protein
MQRETPNAKPAVVIAAPICCRNVELGYPAGRFICRVEVGGRKTTPSDSEGGYPVRNHQREENPGNRFL